MISSDCHPNEILKIRKPTLEEVKGTLRDLSNLLDFHVRRPRVSDEETILIDDLEEKDYETDLGELWMAGLPNQRFVARFYSLRGMFGAWPDNVFYLLKERGIKASRQFWEDYAHLLSSVKPYEMCAYEGYVPEITIPEAERPMKFDDV